MRNFIRPKKPTYTAGRIVIHSDDGRVWDYTNHFQIIRRAVNRYDQFNFRKCGIFSPGINTAYTDGGMHRTVGLPVMNWEQVKEIANGGGEILSHVMNHVYLSYTRLSQPVDSGTTRIYYSLPWGRFVEGYKVFISEGDTREDLMVVNVHDNGGTHNYIDVETPLLNSYTTAANLHLHEETLDAQLGGVVDDLAAKGITCKHHINPWYDSSPLSRTFLEKYFDSAITQIGATVTPEEIDFHDIRRTKDIRSATIVELDAIIADVQAKDGVAFIQMHGNPDPVNFKNLDYIVSKALESGVRVVTHSEAIDFIKERQANA